MSRKGTYFTLQNGKNLSEICVTLFKLKWKQGYTHNYEDNRQGMYAIWNKNNTVRLAKTRAGELWEWCWNLFVWSNGSHSREEKTRKAVDYKVGTNECWDSLTRKLYWFIAIVKGKDVRIVRSSTLNKKRKKEQ